MRYRDIKIVERRRTDGPDRSTANEILSKYGDYDGDDLFVSYTIIEKVGINPRSGYNTPIGVYTYPMAHVIKKLKESERASSVEYMGDSPYINVIRAKNTDRSLDLDSYDNFDQDLKKLQSYFVEQKNIFSREYFDSLVFQAQNSTFAGGTPAAQIWALTRTLSLETASQEKNKVTEQAILELNEDIAEDLFEWSDSPTPRSVVIWNGILRNILGYDYANDHAGRSIIHSAEPTQAVFFSKAGFDIVERFNNRDGNRLNYQLNLTRSIDNDNRRTFEIERLISANINNSSSHDYLRPYFSKVRNPKVQKKIINTDISLVTKLDITDSGVQEFAKNKLISEIKKSKFYNPTIDKIMSYSSIGEFFKKLGSGDFSNMEQALLERMQEIGSTHDDSLHRFLKSYVLNIRRERWPEAEHYFQHNRSLWEEYKSRFKIIDDAHRYFLGDYVIVNNDGEQNIAKVVAVDEDKVDVADINTKKIIQTTVNSDKILPLTDRRKLQFADKLPYGHQDRVKIKNKENYHGEPLEGIVKKIDFPVVSVEYYQDPQSSYGYPETDEFTIDEIEFVHSALKPGDSVKVNNQIMQVKKVLTYDNYAIVVDHHGFEYNHKLSKLVKADDGEFEKQKSSQGKSVSFKEGDKVIIQTGKHAGKVATVSYAYGNNVEVHKINNNKYSGFYNYQKQDLKLAGDDDKLPSFEIGDTVEVIDGDKKGLVAKVGYVYSIFDQVELTDEDKNYIGTFEIKNLKKKDQETASDFKVGDTVDGPYNKKYKISNIYKGTNDEEVAEIESIDGSKSFEGIKLSKLKKSKEQPDVDTELDTDFTAFDDSDDGIIDFDVDMLTIPEVGEKVVISKPVGVFNNYKGFTGTVIATKNYNEILTVKFDNGATVDIPEYQVEKSKHVAPLKPDTPKPTTTKSNDQDVETFVNQMAGKQLVKVGKQKGYVTYDQLDAVMPASKFSSEQIEDVISMLSEMGIHLVESD